MPNDIKKLKSIMRRANMLTNQRPANGNRSYAMRVAHKIENILTDLRNGYVHFTYVKIDGSHRVALGTLNPMLIPANKTPKAEKTERDIEREDYNLRHCLIPYYDLDKDEWRAFFYYTVLSNDDKPGCYKPVPLNL